MSYLNFQSKYDKTPKTKMEGYYAICGYENIKKELETKLNGKSVLVFDYYPGVDENEVLQLVKALKPTTTIFS
ncbi:MAG: hypothetical protein RR602_07900, partial [Longicatena sp.]